MPPAPTLTQLQSLHSALINSSSRFGSYNFRQHFVRHADDVFQPVFSALSPPAGSTPTSPPDATALAALYWEQQKELEVLKRAAEVNRMFAGPRLVVEHASPITSGGGAGMEASAGGGGQP